MPKRASLPSMLPPPRSTPIAPQRGLPCASVAIHGDDADDEEHGHRAEHRPALALSPTMWPKRGQSRAGIRKIDSIWTKLDSGVGFS